MAFTRANASNWAIGDKLTTTQINLIDSNLAKALDKSSGSTDTLSSIITCGAATAGRIIPTTVTGADGDTTYTLSGGCSVILAGSLTAARSYTLSNTGAITGDSVVVIGHSSRVLTVKNNAGTAILKVGPLPAPATWAEFVFNGTAWILFKSNAPWVGSRLFQFVPTDYTTTAVTPSSGTNWSTGESGAVMASVTDTQVSKSSHSSATFNTVNTGSSAGYAYKMLLGPGLLPDGVKLVSVTVQFNLAGSPAVNPCLGVIAGTWDPAGSTVGKTSMRSGGDFVQSGTNPITWTADQNNTIDRTANGTTFTMYELWWINQGGAGASTGNQVRGITLVTSL